MNYTVLYCFILDPGPSSPHSSDDSGAASSNTNSVESPSDFQGNVDMMKQDKKSSPSDRKYALFSMNTDCVTELKRLFSVNI